MSKKKFILTSKHGRPSTKLVYSKMKTGELRQRRQVFRGRGVDKFMKNQYYRVFRNNNTEELIREKSTELSSAIVIRWGTREDLPTDSGTIVYNTARSIANITNKKLSRELFTKNGVACPKAVDKSNIKAVDLPIIARPFIHSKGRNFIVLKTIDDFNTHYNPNRYYYSAFVDKTREFRIHAGHGKVLAVMEKQPVEDSIAWNRAVTDSDPFSYIEWNKVDEENLKPILIEAINAIKSVNADFGGVDVLMTADGSPHVLEVNSAPTLNTSDYVAGRWAQYIDWLFRSESRREHWDVSKFKKGSSLIWKNYQLDEDKL